jgi:hypothetical protein
MKEFSPDQVSARQEHVRQGVLRPGFLAAHRKRRARLELGLVEEVALLVTKCLHAVDVGNIGVRGADLQGNTQHFGSIAAIEFEILMRLDDGEIPWKLIRHLIAYADAALNIIVDPRA